jgi:hypothetical protein
MLVISSAGQWITAQDTLAQDMARNGTMAVSRLTEEAGPTRRHNPRCRGRRGGRGPPTGTAVRASVDGVPCRAAPTASTNSLHPAILATARASLLASRERTPNRMICMPPLARLQRPERAGAAVPNCGRFLLPETLRILVDLPESQLIAMITGLELWRGAHEGHSQGRIIILLISKNQHELEPRYGIEP